MSAIVLEKLKSQFGAAIVETGTSHGDEFAVVEPSKWHDVAKFLRDDAACDMSLFIDVTAVDYPTRTPRFEVVMHLCSLHKGHRIRVKARIDEGSKGEPPAIRSVADVWAGANWMEREAWDMFGVKFEGHPDLRRILLYEEFEGHPLRKDYQAQHTQPLVPYRPEAQDKLPPFRHDEGMPFGRNDWRPKKTAWGDDGAS
ncbi:MAG: NADH-quinone oxidoreductase subunit C [Polyangiales bacterium]